VPRPPCFAELFDTGVRYTGMSLVFQGSGVWASGLTPVFLTACWRSRRFPLGRRLYLASSPDQPAGGAGDGPVACRREHGARPLGAGWFRRPEAGNSA